MIASIELGPVNPERSTAERSPRGAAAEEEESNESLGCLKLEDFGCADDTDFVLRLILDERQFPIRERDRNVVRNIIWNEIGNSC